MSGVNFDSTKTSLQDLLRRVHTGKMQLPDFQRGWVWDDDRIRGLLASLSVSFPIGAVMLLEAGGEDLRFKPRPVEGSDEALRKVEPETLILDGQQRLTSLYQALMSPVPVSTKDTKGKAIQRHYYIDMKEAVAAQADREDAVRGVPANRLVKAFGGDVTLDLTSAEQEYKQDFFPTECIFDSASWRQGYTEYWSADAETMKAKMTLYNEFEREVIKRFEQYQVPVIELKKDTPKEAVCLVFEKVNTGGVALNVFELLTAMFAASDYQLRDDWRARESRLKKQHPVLKNLQSDDFLQVVSLLVTNQRQSDAIKAGTPRDKAPGISCKRRDILNLTVEDYQAWADEVEKGFERAARFLYGQKVFKARDVPYRTQLVPLAAIHIELGTKAEPEPARQIIARWYWCGVLGEVYGGAIESRFARDLPEVCAVVRGQDGLPSITIDEANFQAQRLLTLRTRNSAAYKGIYALLMRDGACDFRTAEPIEAQTFFDDKIDIHHIFPEKWCKQAQIDKRTYNSIINKAAISARTNRMIGGHAPSTYLAKLQKHIEMDAERMDELLASHRIAPDALRADDFNSFFAARAEALLEVIEQAMAKTITREPGLFGQDRVVEDYDDGPDEWDAEDAMDEDATASDIE
jgi:hypothetical protein